MRGIPAILAGLGAALVAVFSAASCQTYDFNPVKPLAIAQTTESVTVVAKGLKPNMMIVLDRSGSMNKPIDPSDSRCQAVGCAAGSGTCAADCPTRISDLRSAMSGFLSDAGTVAHLGLAEFPTNASCGAPAETDIKVQIPAAEDDASLQATATSINGEIQSITPGGGTPTGQAIGNLQAYAPLQDDGVHKSFFLLLTDGEPNCNANNPNTCATAATCKCTLSSCAAPNCTIGCLDQDGTVATIQSIKDNRKIGTFVVGFGSETGSGNAPGALSAMAVAGGYPRACPNGTDAECGAGDTCDVPSKICNRPYYQAANGAELTAALVKISQVIRVDDPCLYTLTGTPSDPRLLSVFVNDELQATTDWTYDSVKNAVVFQGALCTRAQNATQQTEFRVDIRVLTTQ